MLWAKEAHLDQVAVAREFITVTVGGDGVDIAERG